MLLEVSFAQVCLIDGKNMYSIGSSEMVNGELLALYRCSDGHQMWLSNYDEENNESDVFVKSEVVPTSDAVISSESVSLVASVTKTEDITLITDDITPSVPITKKETVLKIGSASSNYTNDISIKKFGIETLLHKKIESDRVFAEEIEEEKNELLYIMNAQKRLFEMTERKKLNFSSLENPIKFSIYTVLSIVIISSL